MRQKAETYFDGEAYDPVLDKDRLTGQLARVKAYMEDGHWRTLPQIAAYVHGSETGVSAQLRNLRKSRFGSRTVEKRRVTGGLWEYRLLPKERPAQTLLFAL